MVKRKPRVPQSKVWDAEDIIELIAWCDHALQHDEIDFDETIETYLKNSRNKVFTLTQIKRKLKSTWQTKGRDIDGPKKVTWQDEIHGYGSLCLVGLSPADKESIALAVKRLEDEYTARYEFPRHRLRSTSTLEERRNTPNFNADASQTSSPNTAKSRHARGEHGVILSAVKREIDNVERVSVEENASSKKQRRANAAHLIISDTYESHSSRKISKSHDKPQRDLFMAAKSSHVPAVEESEEERSETIEGSAGKQGNFTPAQDAAKLSLHDEYDLLPLSEEEVRRESLNPDEIGLQISSYYSRLLAAVAEIKELRLKHQEMILQLRSREDAANELKSEVELLKSAQSQYDCRDSQRVRQLIADNDREIRDLKEARRNREALGTFTKISSQSGVGHFIIDVARDFQDIYYECRQILYRHESSTPFLKPILKNHKNLQALIYRSLCIEANETAKLADVLGQLDFSKLSIIAIVRQLTLTALRLWIFETDFPQFDTSDSAILAEYRKQLVSLDGPLALRKLDLSVHNSLIQKEEFREYRIQQQAADLAIKLSETLAPFFSPGYEDAPGLSSGEFATWNQDQQEWQERLGRFEDIFSRAYLLKAESMLNPELYEMVTYPPGTRFDKNYMVAETIDGFDADIGDCSDHFVAFCVEHAVFAYPRDKLSDESSIQETVVQSSNFISGHNSLRRGARLLVKATVVLRE